MQNLRRGNNCASKKLSSFIIRVDYRMDAISTILESTGLSVQQFVVSYKSAKEIKLTSNHVTKRVRCWV